MKNFQIAKAQPQVAALLLLDFFCQFHPGVTYKKVCSIIYRKGAIQRTETEKPVLAAKGFNTNLGQFLNFYCCVILLLVTCMSAHLHTQSPMYTAVHLKRFCVHKILYTKNYKL